MSNGRADCQLWPLNCSSGSATVYQVATVDSHNQPHVRSQVHRGFIIPREAQELPLLITSSDVRAPKVTQMLTNPSLEIAWWMEGTQDQFRISGKVFVIPPPDNAFHTMKSTQHGLTMRTLDDSGEERDDGENCVSELGKFDWEKKRREVFEDMSPGMKATWCAPIAPGSKIPSYDEPNKWREPVPYFKDIKTDEERERYETALGNFALLLIEPVKIDWVQLGEHPNRRTIFTRKDESDGTKWDEAIVAP